MRRLRSTRRRPLSRRENAPVHDLVPYWDGRGRRACIAVRVPPDGNVGIELPAHAPSPCARSLLGTCVERSGQPQR